MPVVDAKEAHGRRHGRSGLRTRIIASLMIRMMARVLALALTAGLLAAACRSGSPGDVGRPKLLILGFDGMDPDLVDAVDEGRPAARTLSRLASTGGGSAAHHDALSRVADGMGVVRHRGQSRQAQHLRLSRARYDDVPSRSRHGATRAGAVPLRLRADRQAEALLDPRRHLVLGHRRPGRRPLEHPHGAGHVSARRTCRTASCCRGCRCPTFAARWARSTTSRPTSAATRRATPSSAASSSGW